MIHLALLHLEKPAPTTVVPVASSPFLYRKVRCFSALVAVQYSLSAFLLGSLVHWLSLLALVYVLFCSAIRLCPSVHPLIRPE